MPTPDNASDAQVSTAQIKADELEKQLKGGAAFPDVAKKSSGGPTAAAGGDLGDFKRGALGDVLEKATFSLPTGGYTEPIRTRQGFVILKVDNHQQAGVPPLADVEPQVQEGLYMTALQPALRAYLTKARDEAYVDVKPGFIDTGSNRGTGKPLFTTYTPPPVKKKVVKHQAAEQARAIKAQEKLAEARAKVAEKNAQKAAKSGGVENVSLQKKAPKIRREKVRFWTGAAECAAPGASGAGRSGIKSSASRSGSWRSDGRKCRIHKRRFQRVPVQITMIRLRQKSCRRVRLVSAVATPKKLRSTPRWC